MFQFPALPPPSRVVTGLQPAGLPHSDISGSIPVCGSPELFAAYHVLRRHRKPRHPPFALVLFLVNHLRLHSLKCILPMKLQSLNATRKNSNFIIRLNLFFTSLPLCVSQYCQRSLSVWKTLFPKRAAKIRTFSEPPNFFRIFFLFSHHYEQKNKT